MYFHFFLMEPLPESGGHFRYAGRTHDATWGRGRSRGDNSLPTKRTAAAGEAVPGRKGPEGSHDSQRLPSSCWGHLEEALGCLSTLWECIGWKTEGSSVGRRGERRRLHVMVLGDAVSDPSFQVSEPKLYSSVIASLYQQSIETLSVYAHWRQ